MKNSFKCCREPNFQKLLVVSVNNTFILSIYVIVFIFKQREIKPLNEFSMIDCKDCF